MSLEKIKKQLRRILKKIRMFVVKYKFTCATVLVVALVIGTALCFSSCSQSPSSMNPSVSQASGESEQPTEEEKSGGLFGFFTKSDNSSENAIGSGETAEENPVVLAYNKSTKEGYMNNCIFLGDSRSVAAVNYGFLQDDNVLAQVGIAHTSFARNTFTNNSGTQYTMDSFLMSHPAPVIYLALGVNGMNGLDEAKYKSTYEELVDDIISKAPSSNLVIMSIWPVDDNGRYKNSVQNSWINKYNDFLLNMCEEKGIHYLNVNEILTDSNGQMKREYDAGDGLHYAPTAYTDILEYIIHHPVPGVSDEGSFVVKKVAPNKAYQNIDKDNQKAREQIEAETQSGVQSNINIQPEAVQQQHTHSYTGATCTKPGECSCGQIDPYGKTLSHNYVDGICSSCGRGDPNYNKHTHNYKPATCTSPERCSCGDTRGSAKGHTYISSSKTCTVCGGGSNPNYVEPSSPGGDAVDPAPTPTEDPKPVITPTEEPTPEPQPEPEPSPEPESDSQPEVQSESTEE